MDNRCSLINGFRNLNSICFLRYPLTDVRDSNRTNFTTLFLCFIVPTEGFEPSTLGLKTLCSATELRKRKGMVGFAPTPPWLPNQVLYYWATFLVIWQSYSWCKGDSNSPNPQWELIYSQSSLTAWISHHLWNIYRFHLVAPSGFEPLMTEPKPVVLPLHHRANLYCIKDSNLWIPAWKAGDLTTCLMQQLGSLTLIRVSLL